MSASEKIGGSSVRNVNLDLLRAIAIILVVTYHIVQMSPLPLPRLMQYAYYGQFGVDLFFVLSGWLIGSLYWSEVRRFGKIDLPRFWARRLFRTVPPYLAALIIAWLAVFLQRNEPFDPGYLVFIQNYYTKIPFFLISWSLCIEEHFYLFVPLLLFVLPRQKSAINCLFVLLFLIAPAGRYWESLNGVSAEFGYVHTATHLRTEGLILGFGLAYFPVFLPKQFDAMSRYAPAAAVSAALAFVSTQFLSTAWSYRIEATVLSVGLAATLVFFVTSKPSALSSSIFVRSIAIASYSAYLTHALVIHVALLAVNELHAAYWLVYFPLSVALVTIVATLFYWTVELNAIRWRDSRIPRRVEADVDRPKTMKQSVADV